MNIKSAKIMKYINTPKEMKESSLGSFEDDISMTDSEEGNKVIK
jgi:hypothetical protein